MDKKKTCVECSSSLTSAWADHKNEKKDGYSMDTVRADFGDRIEAYYDEYTVHDNAHAIRRELMTQLNAGGFKPRWPTEESQEPIRSSVLLTVYRLAMSDDHSDTFTRDKTFNRLMNELKLRAIE